MNAKDINIKVDRTRNIERVLWIVFVLNLAVAAAKFFYGLATQSQSMQADGIHSVFDSFGNIIGIIGISLAGRPADKSHPYGHSKFESYGSLLIGILLVLAALEIGASAVEKLVTQTYTAEVTVVSFVVMVGTLVINTFVTLYERKQAKVFSSDILKADASHTLSDSLVSIGVIIGLIFVQLGFPVADPAMALIVMVFILISAVSVFRQGLKVLSDHAKIPSEEIKKVAEGVDGVREIHCVRTRGTDAEVYVDLHLLVDPQMSVQNAHEIADKIEADIKQKFPNVCDVLIHIEPFNDDQEADRKLDL